MDLRGQVERHFVTFITHSDRYRFSSQASEDGKTQGAIFLSDEPDPVGEASGPSTPALLGAAVGHCLSASLLEALRHAHIDVLSFETEAVAVVKANSQGLPRIDHIDVSIRPRLTEASARMDRCADIFERYCTVTASVKEGIDVRVQVDWRVGLPSEELHT